MPESPAPTIRMSKCSICLVASMGHLNAPVMAGLVPAIHVFATHQDCKDVDARHKAGHDENNSVRLLRSPVIPGRSRSERTRNLEIPGSRYRAPRNDGDRSQYL